MPEVVDLELAAGTLQVVVRDGDLATIEDADVVAQRLRIRLRSFTETWFLDAEFGVRYYDLVFRKGADRGLIEAEFRKVIEECPNVERVTRFEMDVDRATRTLTLDFEVETEFGTVAIVAAVP